MSDDRYSDRSDRGYYSSGTRQGTSGTRTGGGYRSGSSYSGTSYDRRNSSGGSSDDFASRYQYRTGAAAGSRGSSYNDERRSGSDRGTGDGSYRDRGGVRNSDERRSRTSRSSSGSRGSGRGGSGNPPRRRKKKRRIRPTAILLWVITLIAAIAIIWGLVHVLAWVGHKITGSSSEQETSAVAETEVEEETESVQAQSTKTVTPFTMGFGGDVMLEEAEDAYASDGISGLLSSGAQDEVNALDFLMINEEFPFGTGGTAAENKQYTFEVDPSYVSAFTDMGVDLVSLANNHTLDFGTDVLSQTFSTLTGAGIKYVGAGATIEEAEAWQTFTIGGANVAFLSASRVLPTYDWDVESNQPGIFSCYDTTSIDAQIKAAKKQNDLVVVYAHWGVEKSSTPEEYQREMAEEFINAGADLVVGSHPHVLQGIEYYNGKPIVYSLGNFIFHETTEQSMLLEVNVDANLGLSLKVVPVAASNYRTYVQDDDAKTEALSYLQSISTDITIDEEGNVLLPGSDAAASSDESAEPDDGESQAEDASDSESTAMAEAEDGDSDADSNSSADEGEEDDSESSDSSSSDEDGEDSEQ